MRPSDGQVRLTAAFEGSRLVAYRDVAGVLTIGFGHTEGVREGDTCTDAQAYAWLDDDMAQAGDAVSRLVTVPLTQGQFDALADFVFDFGAHRLMESTLLRLLNRADYDAAAAQFRFWIMAAGEPQPGLILRRAANFAVFRGGDPDCQRTPQ